MKDHHLGSSGDRLPPESVDRLLAKYDRLIVERRHIEQTIRYLFSGCEWVFVVGTQRRVWSELCSRAVRDNAGWVEVAEPGYGDWQVGSKSSICCVGERSRDT